MPDHDHIDRVRRALNRDEIPLWLVGDIETLLADIVNLECEIDRLREVCPGTCGASSLIRATIA